MGNTTTAMMNDTNEPLKDSDAKKDKKDKKKKKRKDKVKNKEDDIEEIDINEPPNPPPQDDEWNTNY
jgi:hypothetical protein